MDNIRLKFCSTFDESREEWLRLEKSAVFYYFQSFLWLSEWYCRIGINAISEPYIILAYKNNEPMALFPLCINRMYNFFRIITWMGGKLSDYNAPLYSKHLTEDEKNEITEKVLAGLGKSRGIDLLFFKNVPELLDDGSINPMINNKVVLPCTHARDYLYAPYMALSDWESCYSKVCKRLKNDSARARRRLSECGPVEFKIARDADEVKRITGIMIRQKVERFIEMGVDNIFKDADYQDFFIRLGQRAYNAGYLHLSWLNLNNTPVAVHWGILFNSRLYYLMPSYDAGYRSFSPGRLLMEDLIRWCCNNSIKYFDFCLGDEKYKNDWTDSKMMLYCFTKPITVKGSIFDKIYRKARPLAKNLRNRIGL